MPNSTMDDIEFDKFAVGQPVSRLEDPMLLRGDGIYTDDINLDMAAYAYVLRSPFAHGHIRKLDVSAAGAANGVLCVLTAKELAEAGLAHCFAVTIGKSRRYADNQTGPALPCDG